MKQVLVLAAAVLAASACAPYLSRQEKRAVREEYMGRRAWARREIFDESRQPPRILAQRWQEVKITGFAGKGPGIRVENTATGDKGEVYFLGLAKGDGDGFSREIERRFIFLPPAEYLAGLKRRFGPEMLRGQPHRTSISRTPSGEHETWYYRHWGAVHFKNGKVTGWETY